jgi:hypothetical protein
MEIVATLLEHGVGYGVIPSQTSSVKGDRDEIYDLMKGVLFRRDSAFSDQIYVPGWGGAAATIVVSIAMAMVEKMNFMIGFAGWVI